MGDEIDPVVDWSARERDWRRKLGRLKLGAEPLEEQVERYRRATWGLTTVAGLIAMAFVALFTAFRRPDLGVAVAAVLFGPIVGLAWWGQKTLERRAARYESERRAFEAKTTGALRDG